MTQLVLKINPEYDKIVPPLPPAEYLALRESIKAEGQHFPIIINADFEILDGHHRNKACLELGIEPDFTVKRFEDKFSEKLFVVDANLERRHLNKFQEIELRKVKAVILSERAKQNLQIAGNLSALRERDSKGHFKPSLVSHDTTLDIKSVDCLGVIAKDARVGRSTVAKVNKILEKAPEKIQQECRDGKRTINSAYAIIREQERQEQRNDELAEITVQIPQDITLIEGDFTDADIKADSIQLILTDPPYPEQYLPEWDKLSDFAGKVLTPGGFLIAYCGHFHLPYVINTLKRNLDYYWIISLAQPEDHSLVHSRHVFCNWKPILVFHKPPLVLPGYFGDLITCDKKEKSHHEWQQGLPAFEKLIENFCPENGVILDPFAGSGTTIIAAKRLGRKSIGIEINSETYKVLKKRVSEETINVF